MSSILTRARVAARAFRMGASTEAGHTEPLSIPAQPSDPPSATTAILDCYATDAPSAQAAVDIFKGEWSSALPEALGVEAGAIGLFDDARVSWILDQLGNLDSASVLELGPLEGGHTYMLCRAGARVEAVEGNSRAFLKCLIAKELLSLTGANFLYGDFVKFLMANQARRWDLVLASGVLYHMRDPFELLTLMAGATDRLAIWTHYFDEEILMNSTMARQFETPPAQVTVGGSSYTLHKRDYLEAVAWGGFCGGSATGANWLERDDLLSFVEGLGFGHIDMAFDDPHHVNGPSVLLLAQRTLGGA